MSGTKNSKASALAVTIVALCAASAAAASIYASRSAARRFEAAHASVAEGTLVRGSWETIRAGSIIGRTRTKNGGRAYLVVIRRLDAESRSLAVVGKAGSLETLRPLGSSGSLEYAARFETMLERSVGKKADGAGSPLDASIYPIVEDMLATISRLETDVKDVTDGTR